jgi:outer membrane receptor protein involved in Fe transport
MALFVAVAFCCSAVHAQILVHFDLPAQSLARSLKAIGTATNTDVGFSASQVAGLIAPALKADLTVDGALTRVLAGTGLRPQHLDDHTIVIAATASSRSDTAEIKILSAKVSAAVEVDDQIATSKTEVVADSTDDSSSSNGGKKDLGEIVVTGTHIRGVTDSASPIQEYTRQDIDRAGVGTVAEFIQRLPQNFGGGASDATIGLITGGGDVNNESNGTAANLRGLGSNSTLVLVNGRRIAPGGINGDFVDISTIPLAAVDRIEVLTDGSSAIYGSDAVGGVINFIMRKDFDGAETRARYGSATGTHETTIAQTLGHSWSSGSALISYEYSDRTPLWSGSRDFTQSPTQPFAVTLLPQQLRHSAFASVNQTLASGTELFVDGTVSHRSTFRDITGIGQSQYTSATVEAYSAVAGARQHLAADLEFEVSATYATSKTKALLIDPLKGGLIESNLKTKASALSIDPKLDGPLLDLSSGQLRFAVGGQFRREQLNQQDLLGIANFEPTRNVASGYIEFNVPLMAAATPQTGEDRLALSLADRYEHYSDFGSTNNPKVGLIWKPWADLKARGTYGTSFRAPNLSQLSPTLNNVVPVPEPDPQTGGTTNVLVLYSGGNPSLFPEKARTWTLGFDFQPERVPGLRSSVTYYDIRYKNRIVIPGTSVGFFDILNQEAVLGSSVVQRNVAPAVIQQLISNPTFINPFGLNLTGISTVANYEIPENLSVVTTRGIDFDISDVAKWSGNQIEVGVAGTRIVRFSNQFARGSPVISILNTPYNPIDLKLRARLAIQVRGFTLGAFINYVGPYDDNRTVTSVPVASWTTGDVNVEYSWGAGSGFLNGGTATIGVLNIADRAPPFVASSEPSVLGGTNYDGANASPLGRLVFIQLSKRW